MSKKIDHNKINHKGRYYHFSNTKKVKPKKTSEEIEEETRIFLEGGGEIEQCPSFQSGTMAEVPTKFTLKS